MSANASVLFSIFLRNDYIIAHTPTFESFIDNETLTRAFVRSLEIIGEASKKISEETKAKAEHINWRSMAGMRDRLIHDYMGINLNIVWDVVENKIPELKKRTLESDKTFLIDLFPRRSTMPFPCQ